MEEVTSNVTISVMMDYLVCHELEYSGRKDPIFADWNLFADCDAHWPQHLVFSRYFILWQGMLLMILMNYLSFKMNVLNQSVDP